VSGSRWLARRDGAVARFLLESRNRKQTLSPALLTELAREAGRAARSGAALLVIESACEGIFAAGADLSAIERLTPAEAFAYAREGQEALQALRAVPAPVLAEIDGPCFGGALDLAMACDVRLATARSSFSHPGARIGIITGWGGTVWARGLLGVSGMRRLFRSGEVFDAQSARQIGLIDEVVDLEEWNARRRGVEEALARESGPFLSKPFF
jgi:enoyl-CoA hydratase/carnithine racemase